MYKKGGEEIINVDLNDLIQNVLELMRAELQRRGIDVQTALTGSLPLVTGRRGQLQQVILNLVRNAADAMDTVSTRARVLRVKTAIYDSNRVLVSVEDSGRALIHKHRPHLRAVLHHKIGWVGMGLAICRSLIEAHGGRLWASSGVDHGSVFSILLPAIGHKSV